MLTTKYKILSQNPEIEPHWNQTQRYPFEIEESKLVEIKPTKKTNYKTLEFHNP